MIYFVTENYLKTNTALTKNIQASDIAPFVKTSSDMRVQTILGTYFYDYLLTAFNTEALTTDEEALVNKIKPFIAWLSAEQASISLSFQVKNKGVQVQQGEFSSNASLNEVQFLAEFFSSKAKFYEERLVKYLKANASLFPQFTSDLNDSDIKPMSNQGYKDNFGFFTV